LEAIYGAKGHYVTVRQHPTAGVGVIQRRSLYVKIAVSAAYVQVRADDQHPSFDRVLNIECASEYIIQYCSTGQ
jgi:hypothetical protein